MNPENDGQEYDIELSLDFRSADSVVDISDDETKPIFVEGYLCRFDIMDDRNTIITRGAALQAEADFMRWGAMTVGHPKGKPLPGTKQYVPGDAPGTVIESKIDDIGWWIRALIDDPWAKQRIINKVYRAFSIAAFVLDPDPKIKGTREAPQIVKRMRTVFAALVNIPGNYGTGLMIARSSALLAGDEKEGTIMKTEEEVTTAPSNTISPDTERAGSDVTTFVELLQEVKEELGIVPADTAAQEAVEEAEGVELPDGKALTDALVEFIQVCLQNGMYECAKSFTESVCSFQDGLTSMKWAITDKLTTTITSSGAAPDTERAGSAVSTDSGSKIFDSMRPSLNLMAKKGNADHQKVAKAMLDAAKGAGMVLDDGDVSDAEEAPPVEEDKPKGKKKDEVTDNKSAVIPDLELAASIINTQQKEIARLEALPRKRYEIYQDPARPSPIQQVSTLSGRVEGLIERAAEEPFASPAQRQALELARMRERLEKQYEPLARAVSRGGR